jgi:hypothetical protein
MFENSGPGNDHQESPEERLWRAVIARTLEEWVRGPLRYSRNAEQYLFDDNRDFLAVCSSAGIDPGNLRRRLLSIRARGLQKMMNQIPGRRQKKSDASADKIFHETASSVRFENN